MFHSKVDSLIRLDSLDHPLVTFYLLHFLSSSLDCRCSSTPLLFLSPRYLFILFVLCFSKFFSVALSVFFINMQLKLPNGMCSIIFSISIANLASVICFFSLHSWNVCVSFHELLLPWRRALCDTFVIGINIQLPHRIPCC